MSEELLLFPAIVAMLLPLLVNISVVTHLRTLDLCPCPKEDCAMEVFAGQTISDLTSAGDYTIAGQSVLVFK